MAAERRVVVLAFDGVQSLDVTGPMEVFHVAARHGVKPQYTVEIVAPTTEPITTTSGISINPTRALADVTGPVDTFVVAGGEGVHERIGEDGLVAEVRRVAGLSRRITSVCSGAFLLAEAGLLDGRTVTTHWGRCRQLAREYPAVTVDPDPIFVRDGNVFTSAGVTAGIDLCLALVEDDHGRDLALSVARQLVVFLKRPGGQAQFSSHLSTQVAERDALAEVQTWIADHLDDDLTVPRLAARAAMSPRHFAREFRAQTGVTPARYVERARVEHARTRLEESTAGIEEIAHGCGFGTPETMRRAFLRALRVGPSEYRQRFRTATRVTVEVSTMSTTTGIMLFDNCEELDFAGPYEVFGMARTEGDQVVTIAERAEPITCAKGLRVLPHHTFADAPKLDVLIVPGGHGRKVEMKNQAALDWIASVAPDCAWVTSVCTGAFVLHAAGPAHGKNVTTHWASIDELRALPDVTVHERVRYVRDGNVVTAAGVSAGIDMALWVVGQIYGVEHARVTQYAMEYEPAPPYTALV